MIPQQCASFGGEVEPCDRFSFPMQYDTVVRTPKMGVKEDGVRVVVKAIQQYYTRQYDIKENPGSSFPFLVDCGTD